jgi:hypothetical protein
MTKMTPTEEAKYALDYNLARDDLPTATQAEYDRLKDTPGYHHPAPNAIERETEGRQVIDDAKKALADNRRVFLCRIPMMYDRLPALGTSGLASPSSIIEAIEDMGWNLTQPPG